MTKLQTVRSVAQTAARQDAAKVRVVSVLCRLSVLILLGIMLAIIITALTGCQGVSASIKQETQYGTATVRTQGGKTSIDFELPRK